MNGVTVSTGADELSISGRASMGSFTAPSSVMSGPSGGRCARSCEGGGVPCTFPATASRIFETSFLPTAVSCLVVGKPSLRFHVPSTRMDPTRISEMTS